METDRGDPQNNKKIFSEAPNWRIKLWKQEKFSEKKRHPAWKSAPGISSTQNYCDERANTL